MAGICEGAGGQIDGASERSSSIPISASTVVRPPVRVEPPPPPSGRGSHRSSDYRFPGGGPHRRRRTEGNDRPSGRRTAGGSQPGRHHLSDSRDEGKEDLGFAFLLWNGVNDAM